MMSPDKHTHGRAKPTSSTTKDETLMNSNNNTTKQPSSSSSPSIQDHHHHQPQPLNCPRCDSPNTKFCYYNNYSLTQPRHFCKTCRRYWTKGGALRNVPVGGGCRKNKKVKPSSSSPSSRLFSGAVRGGDSFQGFLSPAAIDYQLGGSDSGSAFSARSLYNTTSNHFPSFGEMIHHNNSASTNNPSCFTIINDNPSGGNPNLFGGSLSMGFDNYLKPQPQGGDHHQHNNHGGVHVRGGSRLTSSIESLSSINQDLHLKLQQQRMALLLGVGVGGGGDQNQQHDHHEAAAHHHVPTSTRLDDIIIEKRPESILFQDLEISRAEAEFGDHHVSRNGAAGSTIEWFFDSNNPYSQSAQQVRVTTTDPSVQDNSQNWSSGIQAWCDLPQYNALH